MVRDYRMAKDIHCLTVTPDCIIGEYLENNHQRVHETQLWEWYKYM